MYVSVLAPLSRPSKQTTGITIQPFSVLCKGYIKRIILAHWVKSHSLNQSGAKMAARLFSLGVVGTLAAAAAHPKLITETVTVKARQVFQEFDGIGMSEAFGHAAVLHGDSGLSAEHSTEILDYLFSNKGAALTILRNDITEAIEPNSPGSPSAAPQYVWDDYDDGQLWLSQQAYARGVRTFYADAWSAPHYMKTNNNTNDGGYLCGVTNATCATGDWRVAYAVSIRIPE